MIINVALIDDQLLFREGLKAILKPFRKIHVISETDNAVTLLKELDQDAPVPDVVIISSKALLSNNNALLKAIKRSTYFQIKVLALLDNNNVFAIGKMKYDGVNGILTKDASPDQLKKAITRLVKAGSYFPSDLPIIESLDKKAARMHWSIQTAHTRFLALCATDLSYKEIGIILKVSPRTVEGYRDNLFIKFRCTTRSALVAIAISNGIIPMADTNESVQDKITYLDKIVSGVST